jgi:hypothetical protein
LLNISISYFSATLTETNGLVGIGGLALGQMSVIGRILPLLTGSYGSIAALRDGQQSAKRGRSNCLNWLCALVCVIDTSIYLDACAMQFDLAVMGTWCYLSMRAALLGI